MRVNLRGAWLVARAAVPLMRRRGGGAIVFTASISGMRGHPGSGAYAASKAGVLGLSRSLAAEVARDGIRVNCVCPGAVATPMGGTLEELEPFARINPLGPRRAPGGHRRRDHVPRLERRPPHHRRGTGRGRRDLDAGGVAGGMTPSAHRRLRGRPPSSLSRLVTRSMPEACRQGRFPPCSHWATRWRRIRRPGAVRHRWPSFTSHELTR